MDKKEIVEEKASNKKAFALGASVVFVLCIGIAWGYVASETTIPDSCPTYEVDKKSASKKEQSNQSASDITYATFTLPDAYFTFEYPANWIYEKEEFAPGKEYNEIYYAFYTDKDKKTPTFKVHYPMYETAMDTCLKFDEITDYMHKHIATNDSGTFVNYMTCKGSKALDYAFWGEDTIMGDIFWQKGVWDGDKNITSDINTQVRIHWEGNAVPEEVSDHVAHSVKIVK